MKSKEALKRIETAFPFNREGKTSVYREYTNSIYPYYEDFDLVMSDLELLEILKKYTTIESRDYTFSESDYFINGKKCSEKEYEIVKESSENDK